MFLVDERKSEIIKKDNIKENDKTQNHRGVIKEGKNRKTSKRRS